MSEWKLNRGEWAEGYVFLKVLGDGRIHAGTADLKPIEDTYMDVRNVQKRLGRDVFTFERTQIGRVACLIECRKNGEKYIGIPSELFDSNAGSLYKAINNADKGNISVPEVQQFFESINVNSIKSPPMSAEEIEKYGGKTDIFLRVRNSVDNMEESIGFSIKSHFGSSATLLNCGPGTNYLFEIENCSDEDMLKLNSLDSIREKLKHIKESDHLRIRSIGSSVVTPKGKNSVSGPVFDYNLEHVDSNFPRVIPEMLLSLHGYYDDEPKSRNIPDVVDAISKINPLGLRSTSSPYVTMFKNLLFSAFSGLTATTLWDGKRRVTGGYLDVSENGNILYFRALSDDQFLTYLYNSTCIDNPSRGARQKAIRQEALKGHIVKDISRYKGDHGDYGYVFDYNDNGETRRVLGINFQIRFRR